MALIERITLPAQDLGAESNLFVPGLRISIRSTTSSLSDYPEWSLDDLASRREETVITDGSCS